MEPSKGIIHPYYKHGPATEVRVLLIDDDEDDFILIRDLLADIEKVHFNVSWISNSENTIKTLINDDHDICLLDYRLGGYNGLEILKKISLSSIRMPVILLTGHGDYELDTAAMRVGVDDYLSKNEINPALLERSIRYAIERKKSRIALEKAYTEMEQAVLNRTAELAEANTRIKESSEKIERFAFSISHDLRNPAISIFGLTKRLFNEYSDLLDNRGKNICTQIVHASEQIVSLLENISAFIKVKEMPVRYEMLNLSEICRIIREEFASHFTQRGIEWSEPDAIALIKADRLSILRALRNLVDNALKYGGDALSRIYVTYRDSGEYHIISINDNGVGLMDEDSQKIFSMFVRGKNLKKNDGTGMGLAIVKEIAERHGGKVWVESFSDKGLTISMSFSKSI